MKTKRPTYLYVSRTGNPQVEDPYRLRIASVWWMREAERGLHIYLAQRNGDIDGDY